MPKTWSTGELVTAANFNLLPRVLYRDVLAAAATSVTIADADILGVLADWETVKLTVSGSASGVSDRFLYLRVNGDTTANYRWEMVRTFGHGRVLHSVDPAATELRLGTIRSAGAVASHVEASILGHSRGDRQTSVHVVGSLASGSAADLNELVVTKGFWAASTVVTSLTVLPSADSLDAGTLIMLEGQMRREPS